jgi:DNA-binding HxlR family transcriptional regulator
MLKADYSQQNCSIARTLELVGERWTLLVLREVFLRVRRFDAMQRKLGIARNVLSARLERLVGEGILEKVPYKGLDLWPIIIELLRWGDRYAAPNGPPIVIRHKECGGELGDRRICTACGEKLSARDVRAEAGPGMHAAGGW